MSTSNSSSLPKLLKREVVLKESFFEVQRDELQVEGKDPYTYYSLVTPATAVIILPFTPEGDYLLIEEYRHPTGKMLLACPGGYVDKDEDPLEAARRELIEETGFQAENFTIIGRAYPYAGFSRQQTIYVRATGVALAATPTLEASEIIQIRLVRPSDLNQLIDQGVLLDGTLCTALFFHKR
jgi:ADP-ribose pyrophosphatase